MKELNDHKIKKLGVIVFLCLTLGLAPFVPEPHIWMDLKWVWTGGSGMKLINWFDLFFHGAPWIWLFIHLGDWLVKIYQHKKIKL